ncbi:MAG TPA: right-handed parallel beta-helix repeat-containing protein, partial [Acidiferrobacterales bacterium]|nr:right-handed parallel beta-helix repeat-containing protein [Acidiferrobacterales bacterium]
LGSIDVSTVTNTVNFDTTLPNIWVNKGDRITATATVQTAGPTYGSTSEFAANVTATSTGIIVVDTTSDVADGTTTSITNLGNARGADGRISLREAIIAANNTANGGSADRIVFNIAGSGSRVITPLTALPTVTDAVSIDGTTQAGWIVGSYLPIVLDGNDVNANGLDFASGSSGSTVRGLVVRDFGQAGILANSGSGIQIFGNFIGTFNSDGTVAAATETNALSGIRTNSGANVIGGSTIADRNYIGGNTDKGIDLQSSANVVQGNVVGLAPVGTAIGNTNAGIVIWSSNNLIGGTTADTQNVFANSSLARGVAVRSGSGNAILGNAIFANQLSGIDLNNDNLTLNDAGDSDTGPNNLQNFPVLTTARTDASNQLILTSTLNSTANSYYRIEFFSNTTQDGSGYGEGQTYLGFVNVATDGSGNAAISATLSANVAVGTFISATATKSNITYTTFTDTSEFARNVAAVSSAQATITVDTTSDLSDGDTTSLSTLLANKGADGFVSLREAIIAANNTANGAAADTIAFAIPTSSAGYSGARGVFTISLSNALPAITDAVTIDGTTQATNIGNTNAGFLGSGGTVGVDGSTLSQVARPEIELRDVNFVVNGFNISAANVTVRGLAIYGFNNNINVGNVSGTLIEGNVIGSAADSFTDPGAVNRTEGNGIVVGFGDNGIIRNNLIGYGGLTGVQLDNGADNWLIENNEIRSNSLANATYRAIGVVGTGDTIRGNLLINNQGSAVEFFTSGGSHALVNNTITGQGSGFGAQGFAVGVTNAVNGMSFDRNQIVNNTGIGVLLTNGNSVTITANQIYGNTGLGIDLGYFNGPTANDVGDSDGGPNNLQNFPVLASATTTGSQVTFTGTLNSIASTQFRIEFFASAAQDGTGYGEGQRYLGFANVTTDGSGNATISTTLTATVAAGEFVSATATKSNPGFTLFTDTSEFAQNVIASVAPVVTATGTALTYTENASATAVDVALTVSDADSANLTGATVTISANYANGQDVLAFANQLGITGSWSAATGVMTLTGTTTVANYQAALRAVTYSNSSDNPSTLTRTVSFVANDGTSNSAAATRNISVTAVNDAPVLVTG